MAEAVGEGDRRFLAAAIGWGAGALGAAWPNPSVGALLVKDGRVIGRGRTASGGRPHAETLALDQAGAAAAGATLYVSLEPCSHFGRTPPCADAIIRAGVGRVVAGPADPDPRVAGVGFERLRRAGIAVAEDVLPAAARSANAGHLARVTGGRPHVLLKLAVSADDGIGLAGAGRTPVSGAIARRHAQALRSRVDAILVGRGTIEADDPDLTCRLPGLERRSPVRVVLDTRRRVGGDRRILAADSPVPTWFLCAPEVAAADGEGEPRARRRRDLATAPAGDRLDLGAALARLAAEGIGRLLVEGGASVARSLLEADLVDEVMLFRSPVRLGPERVPALAGLPLSVIESSQAFRRTERRMFGPDRMVRYERLR